MCTAHSSQVSHSTLCTHHETPQKSHLQPQWVTLEQTRGAGGEGQRADWQRGLGTLAEGSERCSYATPVAAGGMGGRLETAERVGVGGEGPHSGCCSHWQTESAPYDVLWVVTKMLCLHRNGPDEAGKCLILFTEQARLCVND